MLRTLWADVLYNGSSTEGVIIPYNVGPIDTGKITVLGTGSSRESVRELFTYVKSKLK